MKAFFHWSQKIHLIMHQTFLNKDIKHNYIIVDIFATLKTKISPARLSSVQSKSKQTNDWNFCEKDKFDMKF